MSKTNEKGITLIALIITIIVLLILSLVTINSLFSNDSAMEKARQARENNEKGEISDMLALAVSNIKLKKTSATESAQKEWNYYYGSQADFVREGSIEGSYKIYGPSDECDAEKKYSYNDTTGEVKLTIKKIGGTGIEYKYELNVNSGNVKYAGSPPSDNSGSNNGENTGGNNTGEQNGSNTDVPIIQYVNPEFYVCDKDGNTIENQDQYSAWFDNDLSTDVYTSNAKVQIKWNGDITGKQMCVTSEKEYIKLVYKNESGETLNAYKPDGTQATDNNMNYQAGGAVTYVPEGTKYIELIDNNSAFDCCEIQLFEAGKYANSYISDIKKTKITAHNVGIKWTQNESVQEVKVYKDGIYLGTSTNGEYTVESGLMNNTSYNFYLEPITNDTTDSIKNQKTKIEITTPMDFGGFYIEGTNNITKKQYANWIDGNNETYKNTSNANKLRINWQGNIEGKKIYVLSNKNYITLEYKNEAGETLNAYKPDGTLATSNNMNYINGGAVTYVPEGAKYLELTDKNGAYDFYEIQLFEEGMYWDNCLTNIKAENVDKHSLSLSWDKQENVTKTKIYQDGIYIGETEGTTYNISGGLLSNTEYEFEFEPVTENTTDYCKNRKNTLKVTTKSDGVDFYIEGTNNITKKQYTKWFDGNNETYIHTDKADKLRIKWQGNIEGKKINVVSDRNSITLEYKNEDGETLNAYKTDGTLASSNNMNYQGGGAVTYVPEGTAYLELTDRNGIYNFFEIELVEE